MPLPIDKTYLLAQLRNFKTAILDPDFKIQKTELPTASEDNEGAVFQYVGTDTTNYTIGGFYQCREVTPATNPPTYTWVEVSDAIDNLIGSGDNPPFVHDTTILNYIKGLDSDVSFVTFAVANSASLVTDKPANKGFYYFGHKIGTSWQIIALSTDKNRCYMTNFGISASEIYWMELMTRDSFKWTMYGQYDLTAGASDTILNLPDTTTEVLIYYGRANGANQVYGGSSLILQPLPTSESHPCIVSWTQDTSAGTVNALLYAFFSANYKLQLHATKSDTRVTVFTR